MEQPVVCVSNCVICDVICCLTAQNLNGSEIYQKIVATFGENIITEQKVFHQMFQLFSNRFRYHLGFEKLTQLDTPTIGLSLFILTSRRLYSSYHDEIYTVQ